MMLGTPTLIQTTEAVEALTFKRALTIGEVRQSIGLQHSDKNVRDVLKSLTEEGLLIEQAEGRGGRLFYIRDSRWPTVVSMQSEPS